MVRDDKVKHKFSLEMTRFGCALSDSPGAYNSVLNHIRIQIAISKTKTAVAFGLPHPTLIRLRLGRAGGTLEPYLYQDLCGCRFKIEMYFIRKNAFY